MTEEASKKPSILDEPLQIEGGNVVVSLSDKPCDQLLVRSDTLKRYPRFDVRLREGSRWSLDAPVIFYSAKGKDVRLYKYRLELRREGEGSVYILEDVVRQVHSGDELLAN